MKPAVGEVMEPVKNGSGVLHPARNEDSCPASKPNPADNFEVSGGFRQVSHRGQQISNFLRRRKMLR
jgi:hypothetical protein